MQKYKRAICAVIGGGLAALLLTAAVLSPDARGHGTHEQLGLPPCTFATLCEMPCPLCGMTTAWCYLMHGNISSAMSTHATGTLLAVAAFSLCVATLVFAACGKTFIVPPPERAIFLSALAFLVLVIVEWIVRLNGKWIFLFGGS